MHDQTKRRVIDAHAKRLGLQPEQLSEALLSHATAELLAWATEQEEADPDSVWHAGDVPDWLEPYLPKTHAVTDDASAAMYLGREASQLRAAVDLHGPGVTVTGKDGRTATFLGTHPNPSVDGWFWWRITQPGYLSEDWWRAAADGACVIASEVG